ncbi:MAG: uracil-DNA glycosylase family protein [Rhodospirillales bacterium]
MSLPQLLKEVQACRICAASLKLGPRPVLRASTTARLLIVGQAPGSKVHASGVPWDDKSGTRLRQWAGLSDAEFYDAAKVAILPMGFCYPGAGASGDNPPRPECAPHWHARLSEYLPQPRLTLLVGQYAQRYYLGTARQASLTETVKAFAQYRPAFFPLPHPSWRSTLWMRSNPWFERDVVPALREAVRSLL